MIHVELDLTHNQMEISWQTNGNGSEDYQNLTFILQVGVFNPREKRKCNYEKKKISKGNGDHLCIKSDRCTEEYL